jgi:hypothetical protein
MRYRLGGVAILGRRTAAAADRALAMLARRPLSDTFGFEDQTEGR